MSSSADSSSVAASSWRGSLGRLGFIGAGSVATTLARALAATGAEVVAVTARTPTSAAALARQLPNCEVVATGADVAARARTIFLAVPDDALASVCESISWQAGQAAIHLSGAKDLAPLATASAAGATVAALHPLMTFPPSTRTLPTPLVLERLAGCAWSVETDDPTLATSLSAVVRALGGRSISLPPGQRVPYHLAAVLASNYVVALLGAAVELWQGFGVAPDQALSALLPLTQAAVESLRDVGLPGALTGPIARGDVGTVEAHLTWLHAALRDDPTLAPIDEAYRALARLALPLALAKGTPAAAALQRLLDALLADDTPSPDTPSPDTSSPDTPPPDTPSPDTPSPPAADPQPGE